MSVGIKSAPIGLVDTGGWADHREGISFSKAGPLPRVLIVSCVRLYRDALLQSLTARKKVDVVGVASIETAPDQVRRLGPEVVVLDASGPSALALVRSLKALVPDLSIVVVTSAREEVEFLAWAEAGVIGYADQNSSADDLATAVQHAFRGEVLCSPRLAGLLASRIAKLSAGSQRGTELDTLTSRERDVIALVAEGLSNKRIAQRLGISDTTVKNHVHNILSKLAVQSRAEAAVLYLRVRQTLRSEAYTLPV